MYRAELSLLVLKYIGMWQPQFVSKRIIAIYNVFSFIIIFFTYSFTISTLMYLFQGDLNIQEFSESLFDVTALLAAAVKIANIFLKRNEILELTDILLHKRCAPQDFIEFNIQKKFDRISR